MRKICKYELYEHYDFYIENLGLNEIPLSFKDWLNEVWKKEKHNFIKGD